MASTRDIFLLLSIMLILFHANSYAEGNDGISIEYNTDAKIISYPLQIKISPNTSFEFPIIVKNNRDLDLRGLNIETKSRWIAFDRSQFSMSPAETKTITLKLLIPPDFKTGDYTINVSLNIPDGGKDTISFLVTILKDGESSSSSRIDEEFIRLAIEDFKKRTKQFSVEGYPLKNSEEFALKAEDSFKNGRVLEAISYLDFGEESLEESTKRVAEIKTFLIIYLAIVTVAGPLMLYYFYIKKSKQEKFIRAILGR